MDINKAAMITYDLRIDLSANLRTRSINKSIRHLDISFDVA